MIRMMIAAMALLLAVPAAAQTGDQVRTTIDAAMRESAGGWSAGDLDAFLAVYSRDPATSFAGKKGIDRGVSDIRRRYQAGYADQFGGSDPAKKTSLAFTLLDFRMLGRDHALWIGRYVLRTPDQKITSEGTTSLIFHRERGGWKIIADHSS